MEKSKHVNEIIVHSSKISVSTDASHVQPWVKPKFERIPLSSALSGRLAIIQDGLLSGS